LQAAILEVKFKHLDQWNQARRQVARRYNELLADLSVSVPYESPEIYHVYHQYTIRTNWRDQLAQWLKRRGIGTMTYYPVPLHRQQVYSARGYAECSLPVCEQAAREVLSLPIYPELTSAQQDQIALACKGFFAQARA
jgi:dTDP-4-amino-4,6-dideoxygalactose transaminase